MACSEPIRARRPSWLPRELPPGTDLVRYLISLPPGIREEMVRALGMEAADAWDREWPEWAHEGQIPEDGDWSACVVMGGRSFGKTRAGAEWIVSLLKGPDGRSPRNPLRIALVGATLAEARSVMVEGRSGLMEVAGPWIREWRPTHGLLKFRTGAQAQLFSGHSPELLRGPEHDYAWCDELAKWEKAQSTWDMLQLGLRLGDRPRALVTTTPRPGPVLRSIMAEPSTIRIGGPSDSNPHNSTAWMTGMRRRHAGTRLERQELDGQLLTDNPGALWTEELIERCRAACPPHGDAMGRGTANFGGGGVEGSDAAGSSENHDDRLHLPLHHVSHGPPPHLAMGRTGEGAAPDQSPTLIRLILAVDPPTGDGTCGIIACAKDKEGRAHILADHSVTEQSPEAWSQAVANAAAVWTALHPNAPLLVVAESNQGGLMVQSVLRISGPALRIKLVPAIQGKTDRAAPVAMLFEAGQVLLHGRFPELEAQLCGMIAGGDYEGPGSSPDRADAMVWGLTELMLQKEKAAPSIRRL
ncbi:MAG TPA: terminase family protein [Allosphingosinicella sp.]|nr:terminase family protein [Allosphingosinicella sp.]